MPNRGLLRRQMRRAWADTIRSAYLDQVISSERALQVHFTARLMEIFRNDGVNRRVFVEPLMGLQDGSRVHPDLLICNVKEIIGVLELKYQPKKLPHYEKDFFTFERLAAHGIAIEIENHRFRGPDSGGGRYGLSSDPVFVWAGIYHGPIQQIPIKWPLNVPADKLMVLHAATRHDEVPDTGSSTSKQFRRIELSRENFD